MRVLDKATQQGAIVSTTRMQEDLAQLIYAIFMADTNESNFDDGVRLIKEIQHKSDDLLKAFVRRF